jgi:hypothetical protein
MNQDLDIEPWIVLYERIVGPYSSVGNDRGFRAFTGISPQVAECIFDRYFHHKHLHNRFQLLIILHYLKDYPTEENAFRLFKFKTRTTYRKYLWNIVNYLDYVMNEIDLDRRFDGHVPTEGLFKNITMVVDATETPIQRPSKSKLEREVYFSGRKKENARSKYNLKYSVGVQISTGVIVFVGGPDPGSMTDIRALREKGLIAEIADYEPFELIIGDKGI